MADGPSSRGLCAMTVPPPPGAGDFFGAATPPPPATSYGYPVSSPATPSPTMSYPGFGAPTAGFGSPPPAAPYSSASAVSGKPELVVVACTLLAVFAAVGLYVAAAIGSVSSFISGLSSSV